MSLRQLCVYVNRFYIHDPILSLEDDFLTLDMNFERVIRTRDRKERISQFRNEFRRKLASLLVLRPLAEADILHVTPTSLARPKREAGAVYGSDLYGPRGRYRGEGSMELPVLELAPGLAEYVNEHLEILPIKVEKGKPFTVDTEAQGPTNSILINFDDEAVPMIFFFSNVSLNEKKGKNALEMRFLYDASQQKIDPETFRNWVLGESQNYVKRRLSDLHSDLYLANLAGAHFLTTIRSSKDLATASLSKSNSSNAVLNTLLKMELPFLSGVTLQDLANARENEAAFNDFRVALDKAFKEIESIGIEERQRRLDEIVRDLILAPLARLDKRMNSLNRDVYIDAALAVGTFVATFVSGGNTLLTVASIAAAAKVLESYKKDKGDQDKIREHPSLFYWEATRAARKRSKKKKA
jgi:hypothetical protein